ncbi:hypothetical protein M885DRAFT_592511 [Pelagophyceae sp. CCMP2097]|nr:hypothetical protein M885DRAFT_592511 [Pelagophyceae sp. CCMP2097]
MWRDTSRVTGRVVRTYGGAKAAAKVKRAALGDVTNGGVAGANSSTNSPNEIDDDDGWALPSKGSVACEVFRDGESKKSRPRGKEKSVGDLLRGAHAEDTDWLKRQLERRTFVGFGNSVAVNVPHAWSRTRRTRFIGLCEDIGFRCAATKESTVLEISVKDADKVESDLRKAAARAKGEARGGGVSIFVDDDAESTVKDDACKDDAEGAAKDDAPMDDAEGAAQEAAPLAQDVGADGTTAAADDRATAEEAAEAAAAEEAARAVEPAASEEAVSAVEEAAAAADAARAKAAAAEETAEASAAESATAAVEEAVVIVINDEPSSTLEAAEAAGPPVAAAAARDASEGRRASVAAVSGDEDEDDDVVVLKVVPRLSQGRDVRRWTASAARLRRASSLARLSLAPLHVSKAAKAKKVVAGRVDCRVECVGAWLTGELRDGRAVVDATGWADCGRASVVAARKDRLRVASMRGGVSSVFDVDVARCSRVPCWPAGEVVVTPTTQYYVGANIAELRCTELPQPSNSKGANALTASLARRILDFCASNDDAACASWVWSSASRLLRAKRCADLVVHRDEDVVKKVEKTKVVKKKANAANAKTWAAVCAAHPSGKYLSEGAFKRVYKVGSEAFAVADLSALAGDDAEAAAAASELEIAMLVTDLVRSNVCPNFVATYDAFECDLPPDAEFWTVKKDQEAGPQMAGRWLYTRMELCGYGDLEGWIGKQASVCFSAETAVHVLFQMCYALFCGRAQHALRHYDIKLLNFLAAPLQAPAVTARYALGNQVFKLAMSGPDACWAKLADFGTSKIGFFHLGKAPTKSGELFTTIENAPVELLTHGDAAEVHTFAADTFSLGLAALHVLGGGAPYEEVMAAAVCPPALRRALAKVWLGRGSARKFAAVARTCRDCVQGTAEESQRLREDFGEVVDTTLFDTLYRFVVLLGLPDELSSAPFFAGSDVWRALESTLLPPPAAAGRRPNRGANALLANDALASFAEDTLRFSLASGVSFLSIMNLYEPLNLWVSTVIPTVVGPTQSLARHNRTTPPFLERDTDSPQSPAARASFGPCSPGTRHSGRRCETSSRLRSSRLSATTAPPTQKPRAASRTTRTSVKAQTRRSQTSKTI